MLTIFVRDGICTHDHWALVAKLGSPARKLRGRTRTFQAHRFGCHVRVLESASGIKEHDAIGRFEESCREQMIVRSSRCSPFGRQENSFVSRPVHKRCQDLLIGQSERNAPRLAQNFKHDGIAVGVGHAKTSCEWWLVLPHLAYVSPSFESTNHARASGRLYGDHARSFPETRPAKFFQFHECSPSTKSP